MYMVTTFCNDETESYTYDNLGDARKAAEEFAKHGVNTTVWARIATVEAVMQMNWTEHAKGISGNG